MRWTHRARLLIPWPRCTSRSPSYSPSSFTYSKCSHTYTCASSRQESGGGKRNMGVIHDDEPRSSACNEQRPAKCEVWRVRVKLGEGEVGERVWPPSVETAYGRDSMVKMGVNNVGMICFKLLLQHIIFGVLCTYVHTVCWRKKSCNDDNIKPAEKQAQGTGMAHQKDTHPYSRSFDTLSMKTNALETWQRCL